MITIKGPRKELNTFIASLDFCPSIRDGNKSAEEFPNTGYIGTYHGIPIVLEESLLVERPEDLGLPKEVVDFINSPHPTAFFCGRRIEEAVRDLKEQMRIDKLKDDGWSYDPYGNLVPPEESW